MRKEQRDCLVLALPALLVATLGIGLGASTSAPWLLLTALSAFMPPALILRCKRQALRRDANAHLVFTDALINVIPHPIHVKDADSRYLIANRAFCDERGLPHAEIIGRSTQEIAAGAPHSEVSRADDLATLAGERISREQHDTHPRHGGERHRQIVQGACRGMPERGQERTVIVGLDFDISRWSIAREDLQISLQQQRLRHESTQAFVQRVLDLIPHPVYVQDAEGRHVIVNRAMTAEGELPANSAHEDTEDAFVLAGSTVLREAHEHDHAGQRQVRIISKGSCTDAVGQRVIVGTRVDVSALRAVERHLQESLASEVALRERTEAFIQRLIDVIPDPVFIKKAGGVYAMINDAFAKYRNVDKQTFKGFDTSVAPRDPNQQQSTLSEDEQVLAGTDIDKEDHTVRQATGEEVFRKISKRRSVFVDGDPVIVGVEHHITRWKIAERELKAVLEREMAQRLRTERFVQDLIDVIPDPVYVRSASGNIIIVNDAYVARSSNSREALIGRLPSSELSRDEDQQIIAGAEVLKEEHKTKPSTGEEIFRIVCKRRCVNVDGSPVIVGIHHYITEWRLAERELKRFAEEDMLTGIANRRHFTVEARRALELAARHGEDLSVLMFDLDYFKHINDHYGHNVGDEVLREMARRMQTCFRTFDLPGRWGGEEFIALLPRTSALAARQLAERLRTYLADAPVITACGELHVSLSGGGAQFRAGDSLESLIARADAALYRAKHGGRNRVEIDLAEQDSASPALAVAASG
ncbi:diguanylate cyclase [Uliginosibacterium sp. H3]|uniref:diguanylate cyclase n=1 Tax=Uliginosibacterium silvisoli TaxID=3114758 RepID=A0ABU6JYE8_9RHOO|nr:diguanylate cyclase [Uliginosibacterium sp. H3]